MPKVITTQNFIDRSNLVHNFKYDYSKTIYLGYKKNLSISCLKHGEFTQTPNNHLAGQNCPKCGKEKFAVNKTLNQQDVIDRMNKVHNFRYNYSKVNYINIFKKVIIICKIHGEFSQTPHGHLYGNGCKKCNHQTVYTKTSWMEVCNTKKDLPLVYIIRCFNETEEFLKIGKTSVGIKQRFRSCMPYSYEVIKIIQGSPDFVWDKEIELQRLYKNNSYISKIWFGGQTECFNISILSDLK